MSWTCDAHLKRVLLERRTISHEEAVEFAREMNVPYFEVSSATGEGVNDVLIYVIKRLAAKISQQGLLISELGLGVGPKPFHFPRRNRIIAALALGVVVIEATENSGSLITARIAADLGREVFALPGPAHDPLYKGCHQLIQQGAKLVCKPNEVLEELVFHKNRF